MKITRLLIVFLLVIFINLPANPVMAEASPVTPLIPANGSWTGTTNLGRSMSFTVPSGGTQWSTFVLTTGWSSGGCSVTLTTTVPGPGAITNDQFSWSGLHFAFTGTFTSQFTASGTYTYTSQSTGCGTFSQFGTWSASIPPPIPGSFGKSAPTNGASGQPLSLNLSWGSSTWATKYEYCYDTTNNNACDGNWIDNNTGLSASISGLSAGTIYYWQVEAKNSSGTTHADGDESAWWSFTTGTAPGAFDKIAPLNGDINQSTHPTLSWDASTGAVSYSYCYDTNNNNACDGSWINTGTNTSANLSGLTSPTNYYWQVKAVNSFGQTLANGDTWWNFTTVNSPPYFTSAPVLDATVGKPYTYNIVATDSDASDSLTITALTKPSWLILTSTGNGTAILMGTPVLANLGANDVTLNVSDGVNTPGSQLFTINVTNPPVIQSTFKSQGAQDGWVLESAETSNLGGTMNSALATFNLGDDAAKKQYRGILSFNTSSLPDNAVITKVTLKVKQQAIVGGGNPVTTFQGFMVDIKKGVFGTTALQASDFQTTASKTYGPFNTALTSGWYSLNLTTGKAYVNKLSTLSGLTQIRMRFKLDDNNNAIANYLSLYSGNALTAGNRPQLIVEYYVP